MAIDFELNDEGIAVITINRPERMNAMDEEHYQGLSNAWTRVRDDDDIRVAIITGAGDKSFTSGADIKTYLTKARPWSDVWRTQVDQLLNRGLEVWKPVISAINGYCLGGGVTLMLATDIRVACESATFSVSEVKRGVIAANGGTQRIISQLPYPIAMEMLLTGDGISAQTAERWGLINKVVPTSADVLPAAREYARRIAVNAPLAVQASKELALRSRDVPLAVGLRFEQLIGKLLTQTDDSREGAAAFSEKRPPHFKSR
tara:strand:- start:26040 stop:26819 length:780 start_codon:yes stop_codon:yes gene_type:complete